MLQQIIIGLISKVCRVMGLYGLIGSKVGVKRLNKLVTQNYLTALPGEEKTIDTRDLYLFVDGLKDKFTLLGKNISDSPHYYLMRLLDNKGDIKGSEYISRLNKGTLDERVAINNKTIEKINFLQTFNEKLLKIKNDQYEPILVTNISNKLYIIDGKHRAALCSYLGKSIKVKEISSYQYNVTSFRMYMKMSNKPNCYREHIKLFELTFK